MNNIDIMKLDNFYGHRKRVIWINERIKKKDNVIDIGCGTGEMLTLPLKKMGNDIIGIDNAEISIVEAKRNARNCGYEENIFKCEDIKQIEERYGTVIVSEVLEHIESKDLIIFSNSIKDLVKSKGRLIITVPNGKGSYERSIKIRNILKKIFKKKYTKMKEAAKKESVDQHVPRMSLSDSAHVQFFSKKDIVRLFEDQFELIDFTGSSMFCGYFINTFVPRYKIFLKINNKLADISPTLASGYYFLFKKIY